MINEGTFQEYDYNEETKECPWKQEKLLPHQNYQEETNRVLSHCVINDDLHDWGG